MEPTTEDVLNSLLVIDEAYMENDDVEQGLQIALDEIIRISDSKYGYIAELKTSEATKSKENPEGKFLYCHAISNMAWDQESRTVYEERNGEGFAFSNPLSIFYKGLTRKTPMYMNDFESFIRERYHREPLYPKGHHAIQTVVMVPLIFKDEIIGQLGLCNRSKPYEPELVESLKGIILRIGNLIQTSKMRREKEELLDKQTMRKAKNLFLANVSHELRTPLNTILGTNALMLDTPLDESQYDYLLMERRSCYQLLGLITDILDINKLEAGKVELSMEPVYLKELLESSYDLIGVEATGKKLSLSFHIHPNVPKTVLIDKRRLQQMINNLLSNSVKFTEHGEVSTTISIATPEEVRHMGLKPISLYDSDISKRLSESKEGLQPDSILFHKEKVGSWHYLKFSVTDTGIGIKHGDLDKLFKSFTQLDSTNTKKHKGTGLGLSITNELCKLMKGKISLDSTYGQGSTFYFIIPLREYYDDRQELDLSLLEGKTFLLVDDKESNLERLANVLDSWGVDYRDCTTGHRAISWMNSNRVHFDLGLIDIVMPTMDGNMLADRIHQIDKDFPMIALSSRDENMHDVSSAFMTHLVKPYSDDQLLEAVIKTIAAKSRKITSSEESEESLGSSDDGTYCDKNNEQVDFDLNGKYQAPANEPPKPRMNRAKSTGPKRKSSITKKQVINRKKMQIDNYYEKAQNRDINILLVEDKDSNRIMLTKMLNNIGYTNIDTATSGPEAVSMVKYNRGVARKRGQKSQYAVVLMDIVMPGEYDGVEASKRIDDMFHDRKHRPKILAVTASVLEKDHRRYSVEGKMDGIIEKPIEKIQKVSSALRGVGLH